ncbi:hypothetical protein C362_04732 [Cryptococcus neoformans Bt1]|nr:hypothetical protein C362_04732 [Cryptococcus neoformans var. grubii Bt1]
MAPSPGKIHQLPVKVLYSLDTSPHSYVTVLNNLQEVYVHYDVRSGSANRREGLMGSCFLKGIARAICFASPECIPNQASLDFSVYSLDPAQRSPAPRAFGPSEESTSWTGRGFLSWALSESSPGSTIVKGRLVQDYEFSCSQFTPEGGLEGLVAAANAGPQSREDDGKGWGLEVSISLRQVNPEGKAEFKGRREFEESLAKGTGTAGSPASTPGILSSPAVRRFASQQNVGRQVPVGQAKEKVHSQAQSQAQPQNGGSSQGQNQSQRQSQAIERLQSQTGSSSRPTSSMGNRTSSSGIPPSSFPGDSRSSNSNQLSSRASSTIPPPPQGQSITNPQDPPTAESSVTAAARSRQITPPPSLRSKSPPPSTPSRKHLHALLRADGMMSPELARHLASNPTLRNLLKAVPNNSNVFTQLRSFSGLMGDKGKKNETGQGAGSGAAGMGNREVEVEREDSPTEPTTPTPSLPQPNTPLTVTQNKSAAAGAQGGGCCNCGTMQSDCWRIRKMKDGPPRKVCDDCGVYFNEHKKMRPPELWNPKPAAINGLGRSQTVGPSSTAGKSTNASDHKRRGHSHDFFSDGPASGLRSSPRLKRRSSSDHPPSSSHSHYNTRSHPPQPPPHTLPSQAHSAPGRGAGGSDIGGHTPSSSSMTSHPMESPRKRYKPKTGVAPSPRMATRASTRASVGTPSDFSSEVFGFSPRTIMGESNGHGHSHGSGYGSTSSTPHPAPTPSSQANPTPIPSHPTPNPAHPASTGSHPTPNLSHATPDPNPIQPSAHSQPQTHRPQSQGPSDLDPEFDINAFLSSMDTTTIGVDNFDLNSLFTGNDGQELNGELNQEIMDLLAGWEENADVQGQEQGQGEARTT